MTETPPPEENLAEEFHQLGKNLAEVLRGAWESPERRKLQQEIANGLSDLSNMMRTEAEHIRESPTGQRMKADAEELRERIRTGEVESKVRQDLLAALRFINDQLRKATEHWSSQEESSPPDEPGTEADS
jgi:succinate dehydrogenase/fumarate reductase flavoprotein subunit